MGVLTTILVILHFIGLSSLLGGFLYTMKDPVKRILPAMFHGILTQLVTGVALVGVIQAGDEEVNNTKIAVKLGVAIVIAALVITNRKRESVPTTLWGVIGGLTLLNVIVAVAW